MPAWIALSLRITRPRSQVQTAGSPARPDQAIPRSPRAVYGWPLSSRCANWAIKGGMIFRSSASSRSRRTSRSLVPIVNWPLSRTTTVPLRMWTGAPWKLKSTSESVTVPLTKSNRPVTSSIGGSRITPRSPVVPGTGVSFRPTRVASSGRTCRIVWSRRGGRGRR